MRPQARPVRIRSLPQRPSGRREATAENRSDTSGDHTRRPVSNASGSVCRQTHPARQTAASQGTRHDLDRNRRRVREVGATRRTVDCKRTASVSTTIGSRPAKVELRSDQEGVGGEIAAGGSVRRCRWAFPRPAIAAGRNGHIATPATPGPIDSRIDGRASGRVRRCALGAVSQRRRLRMANLKPLSGRNDGKRIQRSVFSS